jgi:hypothetical protein
MYFARRASNDTLYYLITETGYLDLPGVFLITHQGVVSLKSIR